MLGGVLYKAHFWQMHKDVLFNDRQRLMLNKVLDGFEGKLTLRNGRKSPNARRTQHYAIFLILSSRVCWKKTRAVAAAPAIHSKVCRVQHV